ncbi:hypothetical protein RQP46_002888 [Phenoliferia psychrophenolica]
MITVHLSGVTPLARSKPEAVGNAAVSFAEHVAPDTIAFQVPDDSTISDVMRIIRSQGYDHISSVTRPGGAVERLEVSISELWPSANWTTKGNLTIGSDVPIVEYQDALLAARCLAPQGGPAKSNAEVVGGGISVDGVYLEFERTLRVPDNGKTYLLPPNLGNFPLKPVASAISAPDRIKSRLGFVAPIYQREALWIYIHDKSKKRPAIKVSVGGVNALTGLPRNSLQVNPALQDYVVAGSQPWIDGVCTEPGVVRQFVAMPLGKGYTVEEQLTGQAKVGGIQLDFFDHRSPIFDFYFKDSRESIWLKERWLPVTNVSESPAQLKLKGSLSIQLRPDTPIKYYSLFANETETEADPSIVQLHATIYSTSMQIYIKSFTASEAFTLDVSPEFTIYGVKQLIEETRGVPKDEQRLIFDKKKLEDGRTLADYKIVAHSTLHLAQGLRGGGGDSDEGGILGISAGGRISQNINRDPLSPAAYEKEPSHRVFLHLVSPEMWERMFGVLPPITKIDALTYKMNSFPWFDLYSETPATKQAGHFQNVQSLAEVDRILTRSLRKNLTESIAKTPSPEPLDPSKPPSCSKCAGKLAACVLRPCSHVACDQCLGAIVESWGTRCRICRLVVSRFVGFATPVESRKRKELEAIAKEIEKEKNIVGVAVEEADDPRVWSVMLDEDRVNELHRPRNA